MRRLCAFSAQLSGGVLPWLFVISAFAFLASMALMRAEGLAAFCGALSTRQIGELLVSAPWLVSPGQIALAWGLMVVAMMTPLVSPILSHVRRSVPGGKRLSASIAFLAAFWAIWWASLIVLLPITVLLMSLTGDRLALPAALLMAFAFSASPFAQQARNACHQLVRIGMWAERDSGWQGIVTGLRCLVLCWPWMVVPQTLVSWHYGLMLLVSCYLFADRIASLGSPSWQVPPAFATLFGSFLGRYSRLQRKLAR